MNFAITYLFHRFFFRITDFFHHWYVDGTRKFFASLVSTLEQFDKTFAVYINIRFFFHPLYKDYSIIGRVLGIIFRSIRIVIGLAVYLIVFFVFLFFYLVWLSIPAMVLYAAVTNYDAGL